MASFDEHDAPLEVGALVRQSRAGFEWVRFHQLPSKGAVGWRGAENGLNVVDVATTVALVVSARYMPYLVCPRDATTSFRGYRRVRPHTAGQSRSSNRCCGVRIPRSMDRPLRPYNGSYRIPRAFGTNTHSLNCLTSQCIGEDIWIPAARQSIKALEEVPRFHRR